LGQQRFKDFLLATNPVELKTIQKIIQSKSNTRVSSAFLNQFMNNSSVLEKESTFKWEPLGVWLVGALVELGCIKCWYTELLLYTNEFSRLPCVLWSVQELVVHPRRRRRTTTTTTTTLGALT